jgi:hypothetical protein
MRIKSRMRSAAAALSGSLCLWATSGNAEDPAAAMRARIAALEKEQAALRALPIEQKWALQEEQLTRYEDKVYEGDAHANVFLTIGRKNLAESRRRRFIEKWGDALLGRSEAQAELRIHGRRMAELKRVQMLARVRKFPALVQQAEELLTAERERHERRLQALKASLGGLAVGGRQ